MPGSPPPPATATDFSTDGRRFLHRRRVARRPLALRGRQRAAGALRAFRSRGRQGADPPAARQVPRGAYGALFAQPHPGGGRQRQHPGQRQAGQVELQGQAFGPRADRAALSAARQRNPPRGDSARNSLRGRRLAVGRQAGRHGRPSRRGQLVGYARQRFGVASARHRHRRQRRDARRVGPPHRQEHFGVVGHRQERAGPRTVGQAVFRPHDLSPLCRPRVGRFRRGRGDYHRQHRAQSARAAENVRLRGWFRRQACRDPLARAETL